MLTGCVSSSSNTAASNVQTGSTFVIGTDAPLAGVASFQVTGVNVQAFTTSDCSGTGVSMLSAPATVDFARYNGLQGLLDATATPVGTYNCLSITLGSATLGYLDTTTTPPSINTTSLTVNFTSSTVNYPLNKPLTVATASAPVGLRIDFDLHKSIPSSGGQITATGGVVSVTPTFDVRVVTNTDAGGYVDELIAAVVTPPSGTAEPNSFVVQGPHGEQFTVNTTSTTEWEGDASLSALASGTGYIVLVSGQLDNASQTMDADDVAILSETGFYAHGLVTYVVPPATGSTTSSFDMYVRGLLPASTGVQLGDIAQVDLNGSEKYTIYWMHNPLTQFLFNQNALIAGQEVAIGASTSGVSTTAPTVNTVNRVTLRHWGYIGTVVAGSEDSGKGTFQIQVNGFAGVVIPQTVTVYLGPKSDFRYGCSGFGNLSDGLQVRVVGLLIKDPSTGNPILIAHHVDEFDFTDTTVNAYQ